MWVKGHGKYQMFWGCSLFLSGLKHLILCPFRHLDKCSEADGLNNLRSWAYMILEWLSFQNEFIPSSYISLYQFTWFCSCTIHSRMSSFRFSFWSKFLCWYKMSFWYHINWKQTLFEKENRKLCRVRVRGAWASDLVRKPHNPECLRLTCLILSCECSMNFTLEWNLFRNQSFRHHINSSKE